MIKKVTLTLILVLLLTSCVKVAEETATDIPPLFVTSTLPPTKQALTIPTPVPPTASPTSDPLTPSATPSCREGALFVEDVTYPDGTRVTLGETFTKTWKLQNVGTCAWSGYTIAFVSGDKMESPDTVPVPETTSGSTADISVNLVAPSTDGSYQGTYELRNADGKVVSIGIEPTFWVKITVGESTAGSSGTTTGQIGNCTYTENPGYVQTLIDLINQARADVGRGALKVNQQLMNAAQGHSLDMACNDFLEHSGSDGTWVGDRLLAAGYPNSYYLELLAIGLPQDAMNQWRIEPKDWDLVINSRVTEIGVGYVYSKFSSYGGYWTVNMGGE
jgi:uncharacterized protein YkwD